MASLALVTVNSSDALFGFSSVTGNWVLQVATGFAPTDKIIVSGNVALVVVQSTKTIYAFSALSGTWAVQTVVGLAPTDRILVAGDVALVAVDATKAVYALRAAPPASWRTEATAGCTSSDRILISTT